MPILLPFPALPGPDIFSGATIGEIAGPAPVTVPVIKPAPVTTGGKVASFDGGNALAGAGNGAAAGATIGGPIGAGIGAALGLLNGFAKPSSTANPGAPSGGGGGLSGAFSQGLSSLPFFGGGGQPIEVTQVQDVSQDTGVNVTNILGGRTFGDFDPATGDFDLFKTIGDVFAIRDAQAQANAAASRPVTAPAQVAAAPNYTPLLIGGGVLVLAFVLTRKG